VLIRDETIAWKQGKTAARHTSHEFLAFLQGVVSLCPPQQHIHIILDNLLRTPKQFRLAGSGFR